ncbi:MBL fold metallo-hydrolase [Shivajiella indica]|uniref:MBL fold metallo-hydrolase n=1 Tax=Shivajiella indica TaxID=872115 RepID=A0ABW5B4G6_9BACT
MKIAIKGVRGSIPASGPETSHFGGNTSCVTVTDDNNMLILDGGSGLQKVKIPSKPSKRIDILLTHLHMDHIQGLGFFQPLFDPRMEVHIWAPTSVTLNLHARLSRFLSPPLFPVLLRDLPCKLALHEISNSDFKIGPFKISSRFIIHAGPTVGFRVETKNSTLAYIPDHEPALGPEGIIPDKKWISGFDIISEADLLIHDAQFTSKEYKHKLGWGHSSMEDALKIAFLGGVKRLLLFHHDPSRTDGELHAINDKLQKKYSSTLDFEFAQEGTEIELG